jgi:hypothetical protein
MERSSRSLPDELLASSLQLFPRWWLAECCSAVCRRWRKVGEQLRTSGDYAPLLVVVSSSANYVHVMSTSGTVVNSFEAKPQNSSRSFRLPQAWKSSKEPCWPTCAAVSATGDRLFISQYRMQGVLEYKITGQREASVAVTGSGAAGGRFTPFPPAIRASAVEIGTLRNQPCIECQYVRSLVTNPTSALSCPEGVVLGEGANIYVCNALGESRRFQWSYPLLPLTHLPSLASLPPACFSTTPTNPCFERTTNDRWHCSMVRS